MFNSLGWPEISVLVVLGLFVFGPERLPGMAADAGRALRRVRVYAKGLTADLKAELGPEVGDLDLASLNPKTFVRRHLLEDDDDWASAATARPRPLLPTEPAPWDPDTT
ncbi:MAG: Sec-independent protein translocase subunit TatB [Frankiaceae bacterium]|nr:Sec-independent protein translocase subunit TatB [Frankiaceae bacterium]